MKRYKFFLMACAALVIFGVGFGVYAGADRKKPDAPDSFISKERQIDLDLSALSGTVVYSQIFNIMVNPDAYLGKVLKISGWYDVFEDSDTGMVYLSCIVPDAAACCAQGIEFLWSGEHVFPDDYPEPGTPVTVTGRLESYQEDSYTYLRLVNTEVVFEEMEAKP